jgi:cytoskeletal protein CcmA (bactofilin family)
MFNKRDQYESDSSTSERSGSDNEAPRPRSVPRQSGGTAMIGPSIQVDGKLRGDEDVVIEGKVKGTVELKNNSVTIGGQGDVQADVYAHSIFVDGHMDGNLYAAEQVVIRKSARVKGSITSPRVSLEDGAQFNGSIDMDSKSESLSKAFADRKSGKPAETASAKSAEAGSSKSADSGSGKSQSRDAGSGKSASGNGAGPAARELNL